MNSRKHKETQSNNNNKEKSLPKGFLEWRQEQRAGGGCA